MGAGSGCARQGEESCLEPRLSIEGRKRSGLFLQEEKSYVCKSRRLKILRAVEERGVGERSPRRAHHGVPGAPRLEGRWQCHICGTMASLQPLQGRPRGDAQHTQGAGLGRPRPTNWMLSEPCPHTSALFLGPKRARQPGSAFFVNN